MPAPRRGELVRLLGEELRAAKDALGAAGDAGGRQDHLGRSGRSAGNDRHLRFRRRPVASDLWPDHCLRTPRPPHDGNLASDWAVCGIISAFNFPVAVWAWNAALALVCGDPVIWKPSEKTPLTAIASMKIWNARLKRFGDAPEGLCQLVIGGPDVGEALVNVARCADRLGHRVDPHGQHRRPESCSPLGPPDSGTWRQQRDDRGPVGRSGHGGACASSFQPSAPPASAAQLLRRLIVHNSIRADLVAKLTKAYASLPIGDPLQMPPLWSAR